MIILPLLPLILNIEQIENDRKEAMKTARKAGGLLFVGCMFIGMAAGWYLSRPNIGLFGGMGLGFIMMAVIIMSAANKKQHVRLYTFFKSA